MSTKIESLARRMVAELARMTDSRPGQGRMLASIALEMDVDWDTASAAAHLSEAGLAPVALQTQRLSHGSGATVCRPWALSTRSKLA
jgi:hypothetical protein